MLHISGSLTAENTGCARWLDKNLDKWSQNDRFNVKTVCIGSLFRICRILCVPVFTDRCLFHSTSKKRKVIEANEKPEEGTLMVKQETISSKNDQQIKKSKKGRKDYS